MKAQTIGEVAKASGISVRTLRHYEALGLFQTHRLENGHRIFTSDTLIVLNRVLLLKRTGMSLNKIAELLRATNIDAAETLQIQKQLIEDKMTKLHKQLELITEILSSDLLDGDISPALLCKLIHLGEEKMTQEQWQKVYDKFYSKEEQQAWIDFKSQISSDAMKHAEEAWPRLIKKVEALIGTDPKAPAAQAVLKEWQELMVVFEPADEQLKDGMNRMYDNLDDWPEDGPEAPFSKEVWAFIQAAGS